LKKAGPCGPAFYFVPLRNLFPPGTSGRALHGLPAIVITRAAALAKFGQLAPVTVGLTAVETVAIDVALEFVLLLVDFPVAIVIGTRGCGHTSHRYKPAEQNS